MEKEEEREEEEEEVESRCCAKRDFVSLITRNIFPPLPLRLHSEKEFEERRIKNEKY